MRVLLLALMIALLPVRGWVGNAMAVDMAAQQSLAATPASAEAVSDTSIMPPDCPMHAQADAEEAAAGAHCSSCNTCQLCLALASFAWDPPASATTVPHAGPAASVQHFSSAERISSLKPPIS
ncbi:MAG: hypothetical protein H0W47_00270 [Polaromonas sp.]|uniref:hypothetical protein n=1 Tax=Polaromonas sp. TaxID=1869339 RepID=UPI001836AABC|nr:hypothetical protein [Polaromonas sp.]MBA3592221.1 hypothetical protein [Polaromonas sp.]